MNQQVANPIEIRASKIAQSAIRYEPDKNKRSPIWDRAIDKEFKFSSATAADRNTAPPPTFLPVMVAVYVRSPLGIFNHRNVILPRFYHSLDILPFSSLHPISFFFFLLFFSVFLFCIFIIDDRRAMFLGFTIQEGARLTRLLSIFLQSGRKITFY